MKIVLSDQHLLIQFAVWMCFSIFIVGFVCFFLGIISIMLKIRALEADDENTPSYWEKAARLNTRFGGFFLREDFRNLRRLMLFSASACIAALAALLLIIGFFGEPV